MDGTRIALMAHMRSGKDYVANHLMIRHGFNHNKFADPFYKITQDIFPEEYADGRKPRDLLQWFGQTMRQRDPQVWVKYLLNRVESMDKILRDQKFVVSDLRQPNEHAALKAAGFAIVRIECSLETRIRRMEAAGDKFDPKDLDHETESHIDQLPADFIIKNDIEDEGTVRDQMDAILAELTQMDEVFKKMGAK